MNILVTAGPTREPIDAVRFISNRSSGKMGYAVARAARRAGHRVVLVSGPVSLKPPANVRVVRVTTAEDMLAAVKANMKWCHALVMAAAVADWRPKKQVSYKIKKRAMPSRLLLAPTPDILTILSRNKGSRILVGFAAETDRVLQEARRKLIAKKLDMIVANDVGRNDSGFDVDMNQVTFISPDGHCREWPLMSKDKVAGHIIRWIEARFRQHK